MGFKVYPRLDDVADAIDLAVVCVPGRIVPGVLEECLAKGIRAAIVLSAGFSETGEEGKKLELELAKVRAKGIRVMGPNCFGVYCPRSGLTLLVGPNFPRESGPIGLVAQSGQFAEMIVLMARGLGLRFSKVISYGNAFDLNEADYLEYLAEDPDTKVIAVYVEGAKQGRRFLEVVRQDVKGQAGDRLERGDDEHGQPCGQFSHGVTGRERGHVGHLFCPERGHPGRQLGRSD